MTLLSIMGTHSIAIPLSPAFPARELKYLIDHSGASLILASNKFDVKAQEILNAGLEKGPKLVRVPKRTGGDTCISEVTLAETSDGRGGMMLYTSGTTNKPVNTPFLITRVELLITYSRKASCYLSRS